MQLVIDIPEETYDYFKDGHTCNDKGWVEHRATVITALTCNSIKFPKNHGRLIEAEKLQSVIPTLPITDTVIRLVWALIDNSPTVVERSIDDSDKGL